jgi:hypothetical protein
VHQQDEGAVGAGLARLQHVHAQAVDALDEAGADAGRERGRIERGQDVRDHRRALPSRSFDGL